MIALLAIVTGAPAGASVRPDGMTTEFIFQSAPTPSCHASTIVETAQGGLVAAWFGGTREQSPDVGIWVSRREKKAWTAPVEVANGIQADGPRLPCWNPVLFQPKSGPLMLFYKVGPSPSTWWGMLRTSQDGGKTWSEARRLPKGILGPIKNKPLQLASGDLVCPSSVESKLGWRLRFERTSDLGKTWTSVAPAAAPDGKEIDAIQPSILVHPGSRLQAIGRTKSGQVFQTCSTDGGKSWTPLTLTGLPNPNSGTDAVTLRDGRHLLVYNHTMVGRGVLDVAVSRDGKAWHNVVSLENDSRAKSEYSYPACIQTRDGMVHITYTWKRQRIKHVVLDPATLPRWDARSGKVSGYASAAGQLPVVPPGVVIDHSPAWTGLYIGSPSIAILPNGDYVASHDFFGPKANSEKSAPSVVFRSSDRGRTWKKISNVQDAFWCSLFVHRGALYLLGTNCEYGNILLRRSNDGGCTWTSPTNNKTGLLRGDGQYHCAPTPILEHNGRLWRGFEWRNPPKDWGINFRAGMMSIPVDADPLDAANWTFSNFLPSDRTWNGGDMGGWLEGNAVATPTGEIVDILRTTTKMTCQKAAIMHISADGKRASFDPATGFVDFPGAGQHKFTIRFDPQSKLYWALSNASLPEPWMVPASTTRNKLALVCSRDLKVWTVRSLLLSHPDRIDHAFQYPDWLFDGNDIIAVSRTAYDDGLGGAHNFHDANFLTFHRVANFRTRTMSDPPLSGK
jgi:predicted neuraminidase